MIKIGTDYEVTADKYQFILNTRSNGKDKDGNDKDQWNKTFHASFEQLGRAILNNEMIDLMRGSLYGDLHQFMSDMRQAAEEIAGLIEQIGESHE